MRVPNSREEVLNRLTLEGYTLEEMRKHVPGPTGFPVSRQRVEQLLAQYGLLHQWWEARAKNASKRKHRGLLRQLSKTARGQRGIAILHDAEKRGYSVEWASVLSDCKIEGIPIAVHCLHAEFNGRFHTTSHRPGALKLFCFPGGKTIWSLTSRRAVSFSVRRGLIGSDERLTQEELRKGR